MRYLVPLALLVAAAFYLLWPSEAADVEGVARGGPSQVQEAVAPRADAELASEVAATEEPTSIERAVVETSAPVAAATEAPAPVRPLHVPTGPTRELFVFHGDTGAPAADVEVLQLEPSVGDYRDLDSYVATVLIRGLEWIYEAQAPERYGVRIYRTDAYGMLLVEDSASGSLVVARVGEREGFAIVGGAWDTGDEVELHEPHGVLLRSLDAAGNTIPNVRVKIENLDPVLEQHSETDAQGELRLHSLDTLLKLVLERARRASPEVYRMGPDGLERVAYDLESAPRGWFTARLDPELRTPAFDPFSGEDQVVELVVGACSLQVALVAPDGTPTYERGLSLRLGSGLEAPTHWFNSDGKAALAGLSAGEAVELRVMTMNGQELASKTIEPQVGVNELTFEIEPPGAVTARFVDGQGGARGGIETRILEDLTGTSFVSSEDALEADSEGRVTWHFKSASRGLSLGDTLTLSFVATIDGTPLVSEEIVLEGPRQWPIDLGDIVLVPSRPFVAGRVVTPDGEPVVFGWVEVEGQVDGTWRSSISGSTVDEFGTTDMKGEFMLFGDAEAEAFRLEVNVFESGSTGKVPFSPGDTGLELVLVPPSALELSVHPDDRELGAGLFVGLRASDASLRESVEPSSDQRLWGSVDDWRYVELGTSGKVLWKTLAPGDYDVRLDAGIDSRGEALASWSGVSVEAGEVARDPRLQDLRLGAWATALELLVTTTDGRTLEEVWWRSEGGPSDTTVKLESGRARVSVLAGKRLVVGAEGYLAQTLDVDGASLEVRLVPSEWIELELPEGLALGEGLTLKASLWPEAWTQSASVHVMEQASFDAGRARVRPLDSSRQKVLLSVHRKLPGGGTTQRVVVLSQVIDPSSAEGPLLLELTEAELEQLR